MATLSLEERVAMLEMEVLHLKQHLNKAGATPWWEQISGAFADTPACEEAVALGRQYREAQHPTTSTDEDENVSA